MKLVVNTLLGVGMASSCRAVALGSALDLPRDLLFDTLAKTAVVAPAQCRKAGYRQKARLRAAISGSSHA